MIYFEIEASETALEYLEEIACEMILLFPITMDEVVGRMNRHWQGVPLVTESMVSLLTHREPDYWANTVYYGRNANWWTEGSKYEPLPYP